MTLRLIEGFDGLTNLDDKYSASEFHTVSADEVHSGTQGMKSAGSTTDFCWMPIPGSTKSNEIYIGFAFRCSVIPALSDYSMVRFYGDGVSGAYLSIKNDGALQMAGSAPVIDSGANVLAINTWYYIEVKIIKSNSSSAGDVIVMVDGVEWINCGAGLDFLSGANNWTDMICFRGYSGSTRYFDDIYICDENGSSPTNTFLGHVTIATLYPDGNGNTNDFTGSDADSTDNYLHVDELTDDDDTSYVESNTPTDLDLYTFDDMPESSDPIFGVQVSSYVKKDSAGPRLGKHVTRVNGSNYEGASFGANATDYLFADTIWELNPDDSAAWENADIDAAEFGLKVEA